MENSFCGARISKSDADFCSKLIKFSRRSRQQRNTAYYSSLSVSLCLFQLSVYAPPSVFYRLTCRSRYAEATERRLMDGADCCPQGCHSTDILRVYFQPTLINVNSPQRARDSSLSRVHDRTQTHHTQ
jgi:hypothetical protein